MLLAGFFAVAIIIFFTPFAVAHDVTPHPHSEDSVAESKGQQSEHGGLGAVGAKLSNPLSDLWALNFNFEFLKYYYGDINTGDAEVGSDMIFQPVMPIPMFGEGDAEWWGPDNPQFVQWHIFASLEGSGLICSRPHDRMGVRKGVVLVIPVVT